MGCFNQKQISLAICTSWTELSEKTKQLDDFVAELLAALNKVKPEDITPTEKEIIIFYEAFSPWDPTLVEGKVFDQKIAKLADNVYSRLNGEKGIKEIEKVLSKFGLDLKE